MSKVARLILIVAASLLWSSTACTKSDYPSSITLTSSEASIRDYGAKHFACPVESISIKRTATSDRRVNYVASGCGYEVLFAMPEATIETTCTCTQHCPVGPGSPGGGTTCCKWSCK